MKGVIFTEFSEMVEELFGFELLDQILSETDLESGGSYTTLGTYDHREILDLVTALAKKTGAESSALVKTFGEHLIKGFTTKFPVFFSDAGDTLTLLTRIENHIHTEVRKLYDNTELPTFECDYPKEHVLRLVYRSHRPFADLAHGMILATADHYGETVELVRTEREPDPSFCTEFLVRLVVSPIIPSS